MSGFTMPAPNMFISLRGRSFELCLRILTDFVELVGYSKLFVDVRFLTSIYHLCIWN